MWREFVWQAEVYDIWVGDYIVMYNKVGQETGGGGGWSLHLEDGCLEMVVSGRFRLEKGRLEMVVSGSFRVEFALEKAASRWPSSLVVRNRGGQL